LNLNDMVAEMLKMLRRLIGEDISLAWIPAADLGPVHMDPAQIDQILANLCVNARDAISGTGKITIETHNTELDEAYCADNPGSMPGAYALLAVSDNGCGMDPRTLSQIFEPFFTTKKLGEGTGLGLATVYGIVKQNGGFINVYSELGKGTTFRIYLPRRDETEDRAGRAEAGSRESPGGGETILFVEDEAMIMNLGAHILKSLGYRVLAANTAAEAIRLAGEHPESIELLVTDVIMPEMNGRELSARLEGLRPGLKTLYMSAYTANAISRHGVLEEGVHFLQKPFVKQELAAKVREALAKAAS